MIIIYQSRKIQTMMVNIEQQRSLLKKVLSAQIQGQDPPHHAPRLAPVSSPAQPPVQAPVQPPFKPPVQPPVPARDHIFDKLAKIKKILIKSIMVSRAVDGKRFLELNASSITGTYFRLGQAKVPRIEEGIFYRQLPLIPILLYFCAQFPEAKRSIYIK